MVKQKGLNPRATLLFGDKRPQLQQRVILRGTLYVTFVAAFSPYPCTWDYWKSATEEGSQGEISGNVEYTDVREYLKVEQLRWEQVGG